MKRIGLFIVIFFATNCLLIPQIKEQTQTQTQTQTQYSGLNQSNSSFKINPDLSDLLNSLQYTPNNPTVPIEGAIYPEAYLIGPNDMFQLGVYGYLNQQIQLVVNPEGTVVIPTVGEVDLKGLNLSEAKEKVISKVKKRYISSEITFNLITPRTFLVSITGLVQGKFRATPLTRASEMLRYIVFDTLNISRTYYEKMANQRVENNLLRTEISARNIELIRKDGSVQKVDMYKYYMTNDDKYNPYLLEGDLLKVPNTLLEKYYVSISGAVQLGGAYEYSEGDDLETLIGLGRGLDFYAEPDSIILYRPYDDKKGFEIFYLSLNRDKDFKVKVYDRAFVKYKSDYQRMATVLVLGEVNMPGYYPISYKNTKLKEVIEMAGGLKSTSHLPLSILFRNWDAEYLAKDSTEVFLNERANDLLITPSDLRNFQIDIKSRRNRVNIDFVKLLEHEDESQNIILEDKDIIYINDNKNIVYVYGQINKEGFINYKKGAEVDYYIENAGGFTLGADEGSVRIIKFNSRAFYKPGEVEIESGDFIYVAKSVKKPFSEILTMVAQISGIVLGVLTTYLLFKNNEK